MGRRSEGERTFWDEPFFDEKERREAEMCGRGNASISEEQVRFRVPASGYLTLVILLMAILGIVIPWISWINSSRDPGVPQFTDAVRHITLNPNDKLKVGDDVEILYVAADGSQASIEIEYRPTVRHRADGELKLEELKLIIHRTRDHRGAHFHIDFDASQFSINPQVTNAGLTIGESGVYLIDTHEGEAPPEPISLVLVRN